MPKDIETYAWNITKPSEFETRTGRQIYEEMSYTGLNQYPITILESFAIHGGTLKGSGGVIENEDMDENVPFTIPSLANELLVSGSFIAYLKEGNDKYEFQRGKIDVVRKDLGLIILEDDPTVTREYQLIEHSETNEGYWLIRDFEKYGTEDQLLVPGTEIEVPFNVVFMYQFGDYLFRGGVLYPAQRAYNRIEEIFLSFRSQTTDNALSLIVAGQVGSIQQAQSQLSGGRKVLFIPGEVTISRVASTHVTDQLMQEVGLLMPLYIRRLQVFTSQEEKAESGLSRRYEMMPMLTYVNSIRKRMGRIYKNELFNLDIDFENIIIKTIDERDKELTYLKRLLNENIIDHAEFVKRAALI